LAFMLITILNEHYNSVLGPTSTPAGDHSMVVYSCTLLILKIFIRQF
jgi:hypothetical protein